MLTPQPAPAAAPPPPARIIDDEEWDEQTEQEFDEMLSYLFERDYYSSHDDREYWN